MSKYTMRNYPYVQAKFQGRHQRPTAIIFQPSFTHSQKGAALGVAQAWHQGVENLPVSHYSVDETEIYKCIDPEVQANPDHSRCKNGVRITICAEPKDGMTFWDDHVHGQVLRNAARLVAELALAYNIKVEFLETEGYLKWRKFPWRYRGGIWVVEGKTSLDFPFQEFLDEVIVQRALKKHI